MRDLVMYGLLALLGIWFASILLWANDVIQAPKKESSALDDKKYCDSWNKGISKVHNADNMKVAAYCAKYL
jgi:hypothetical protein